MPNNPNHSLLIVDHNWEPIQQNQEFLADSELAKPLRYE